MKPKQVVSVDHAINWYLGNYIESPDNSLRDEEAHFEELGNSLPPVSNLGRALEEIEKLRVELKGKQMTHKELIDLMKQRGIHDKYYRYKKQQPTDCGWCKAFQVPRR